MFTCSKCGKPCANGTGKAAHERRCTPPLEAKHELLGNGEEIEMVLQKEIAVVSVIYEVKGWKAYTQGGKHFVKNNIGQVLGEFPSPDVAKRFLENTQRWIK